MFEYCIINFIVFRLSLTHIDFKTLSLGSGCMDISPYSLFGDCKKNLAHLLKVAIFKTAFIYSGKAKVIGFTRRELVARKDTLTSGVNLPSFTNFNYYNFEIHQKMEILVIYFFKKWLPLEIGARH